MVSKRDKKPVSQRLNNYQKEAIKQAEKGDYLPIIKACVECQKAIDKCWVASNRGAHFWGVKSIAHYVDLREYLEGFIDDDEAWKVYQKTLKTIEGDE